MGVKDLFAVKGTKPIAFMCDRCGAIWDDERHCAWCCGPVQCERCLKVIERPSSLDYDGLCWECRKAELDAEASKLEKSRFEGATKLEWSQKTTVVCFPDPTVGYEGFWYDDDLPDGDHEYAWTCHENRPSIEASSIIESILDDFDDAEHGKLLGDPERELQQLVDEWLKKHAKSIVSYTPNFGVCVLLPKKVN